MNVFKIAWRSIQHRGFGSWLTITSMALGIMMVVSVLSIHGLVSRSFKGNNSFGYNMIIGARGGGLQLTMNTVYYLSQVVENVPYEYYLAFCPKEQRQRELKHSVMWKAYELQAKSRELASIAGVGGTGLASDFSHRLANLAFEHQQLGAMDFERNGLYSSYTDIAVPLCMGDFYHDVATGAAFRCVGTNTDFLDKLVLDVETEQKFEFSEGRPFEHFNEENGFNECVIGATVAQRTGLKIGDTIKPTHGDPNSQSSHVHDNPFKIVGILKRTETPHDRVLLLNMEGFFLMDGHTNPLNVRRVLPTSRENDQPLVAEEEDFFADEEDEEDGGETSEAVEEHSDEESRVVDEGDGGEHGHSMEPQQDADEYLADEAMLAITPLPIEQRQVTSFLVRTTKKDPFGAIAMFLTGQINREDDLETTLTWSPYRPERTQKAAQAVNPVEQVTALFQLFVDPIRWLLLALTCLICLVSALSILVGIYNSMSQRQHEIAVIRALGASRQKVMTIMLCEAVLLAMLGGLLGWFAGHALNGALSPWVESQTGVKIGFFDLAPGIELGELPGGDKLPEFLSSGRTISSELLIIPGLMLLAVLVGIYPAISAYRTDVSKALAK